MSEKKVYREFTDEFKREALELLKHSDKSAAEIEWELGISPSLLLKWRKRYELVEKEGQDAKLAHSDLDAAKAEICRLQRELTIAEEERNILKKAINIFSRKDT